jgi:hypothetical protein
MDGKWILIAGVIALIAVVGLVLHLSRPRDPAEALDQAPRSIPNGSVGGIQELTADVPPEQLREPGRHTIVTIYSPTCGPCAKLEQGLRRALVHRPDVAVKRVHWSRYWAEVHDVQVVPTCFVYDAGGKLLARDEGRNDRSGTQLVSRWMTRQGPRQRTYRWGAT